MYNSAVMWNTALNINSILWSIAGVYMVYTAGLAILHLEWKQFAIALIIALAFTGMEVVFAALEMSS